MSAATTIRRISNFGGQTRTPRHGTLNVLRGSAWKMGWLLASHGLAGVGDRLMPYPTGGYNNALTAANGGPLQVPGADGNGGIRVIGRNPNLGFGLTVGGAGALTITVSYTTLGFPVAVIISAPASTTAQTIAVQLAGSQAAKYLDTTWTGNGGGVAVSTGSVQNVPYVRIYGVAGGEADNTADAVNDNPLAFGSPAEQAYMGRLAMLFQNGSSHTVQAPQKVWVVDNQTVDCDYTALCLPLWCSSFEDDRAVCEIK